jgi:spore maturation protein CgeB
VIQKPLGNRYNHRDEITLKILVIGRFYEESFEDFISKELAALGHAVTEYDPGPKLQFFGSKARFYSNRMKVAALELKRQVKVQLGLSSDLRSLIRCVNKRGPFDLILSCHDFLIPNDAEVIKKLTQAPLALWYPDPIWSFNRHMFLNCPFDYLFFKDPYIVDILKRNLEKRVFYLPECFSPTSLQDVTLTEEDRRRFGTDICTAGNLYPYRIAFFQNLADQKIKIWGLPAPRWVRLGPVKHMTKNYFVAHAEKVKAFRAAKIVLNNLNPSEIWGTNVRTFEICGARGFQIVDWRPGLEQLFDIDREVVTFRSLEELRHQIAHYLTSDAEREVIANAGWERAHRDHTYERRLQLLLATVSGQEKGFPLPSIGWDRHY